MTSIVIKAKRHTFPNFLLLDIPGITRDENRSIDVGAAFPSDELAGEYWDNLRDQWIEHVKARRAALGKPSSEE